MQQQQQHRSSGRYNILHHNHQNNQERPQAASSSPSWPQQQQPQQQDLQQHHLQNVQHQPNFQSGVNMQQQQQQQQLLFQQQQQQMMMMQQQQQQLQRQRQQRQFPTNFNDNGNSSTAAATMGMNKNNQAGLVGQRQDAGVNSISQQQQQQQQQASVSAVSYFENPSSADGGGANNPTLLMQQQQPMINNNQVTGEVFSSSAGSAMMMGSNSMGATADNNYHFQQAQQPPVASCDGAAASETRTAELFANMQQQLAASTVSSSSCSARNNQYQHQQSQNQHLGQNQSVAPYQAPHMASASQQHQQYSGAPYEHGSSALSSFDQRTSNQLQQEYNDQQHRHVHYQQFQHNQRSNDDDGDDVGGGPSNDRQHQRNRSPIGQHLQVTRNSALSTEDQQRELKSGSGGAFVEQRRVSMPQSQHSSSVQRGSRQQSPSSAYQNPNSQQQQQQQTLNEQAQRPAAAGHSASDGGETATAGGDGENPTGMDTESLLHNSCKLYPDTLAIVESALQMDPDAIRRPIPTSCAKEENDSNNDVARSVSRLPSLTGNSLDHSVDSATGIRRGLLMHRALDVYSYPVNIALRCNASPDVLKFLIESGPDVLDKQDGPNKASSLGIAIALERPRQILQWILDANPGSARTVDRHSNTALHALVRGCCNPSLCTPTTIRLVYGAYPEALAAKNFHRESPLDVAVRSECCPEEVVNFLQSRAFGSMEANAESQLDDLSV